MKPKKNLKRLARLERQLDKLNLKIKQFQLKLKKLKSAKPAQKKSKS
jgi:hypothetical protein